MMYRYGFNRLFLGLRINLLDVAKTRAINMGNVFINVFSNLHTVEIQNIFKIYWVYYIYPGANQTSFDFRANNLDAPL